MLHDGEGSDDIAAAVIENSRLKFAIKFNPDQTEPIPASVATKTKPHTKGEKTTTAKRAASAGMLDTF